MSRLNYTINEINKKLDGWDFIKTETISENYVNKFTITFDEPLIAIATDFQIGRVEESQEAINIGINWPEDPYVAESRSVIARVPIETGFTKFWGHIELDLRKTGGNHAWATSYWHGRADGGYPTEITPDAHMNCTIGVSYPSKDSTTATNKYQYGLHTSFLENSRYLNAPLADGIMSLTAIGGGMCPGTTFFIYGIRK